MKPPDTFFERTRKTAPLNSTLGVFRNCGCSTVSCRELVPMSLPEGGG